MKDVRSQGGRCPPYSADILRTREEGVNFRDFVQKSSMDGS